MAKARRRDFEDSRYGRRRSQPLQMPDYFTAQRPVESPGAVVPEKISYTQGGDVFFGKSYIDASGYVGQLEVVTNILSNIGGFYEGMKKLQQEAKKIEIEKEAEKNEQLANAYINSGVNPLDSPIKSFYLPGTYIGGETQ